MGTVTKFHTLDEIEAGDRINFYHPPSNQNQWGTVVSWMPADHFPSGKVAEWAAVIDVADLGLGNGFGVGRREVRITIERHRTDSVRFAYSLDDVK